MHFLSYQLFGVVEYLFIKYSQLNELDRRHFNIQIIDRRGGQNLGITQAEFVFSFLVTHISTAIDSSITCT